MDAKTEGRELLDKIAAGLQLAIKRLYEQKAANNENAIISVNGVIRTIPARDLIGLTNEEISMRYA